MEDTKDMIIPVRSPHLTHPSETLNDHHQNHFMYTSSLDGILHQMPHFPNVMTVASWQTFLPGPGHRNSSCEDDPDEKDGDVSLEADSPLSSNGETLHSSQLHAPQSILFSNNGAREISTDMSSSYRISTTNSSSSSSSCSEGLRFTQHQQIMKLSMGQIQQGSVIRVVDHLCSSPSPVVNTDADTLSSNNLLRSQNHVENISMAHISMTQDDDNSSDRIREDVMVAADDCDDEEELKYKVTKDLREMS
ncbi:hypothetical protein J437_LFUL009121 [Ladona fulva]|uniref:Uncharacterized protein n=1 Tax=Ladona fulva TaxID=123851 RepID=A0A8K0K7J1_LADFU|nr:hypothetical protein J437_LFUL009121 [Ladona fulva]